MAETNIIHAPKVAPQQLWQMSDDDFNNWRKQNDYPRIISFLKNKLPKFEAWMGDQKVSDAMLIKHSPSTFLNQIPKYYLYDVIHEDKEEKEILSTIEYSINEIFFHKNIVKQRQDIIPYPIWYKQKEKKAAPDIYVNSKQGRSHCILHELELLDLGNYHLENFYSIGNRNLDFVNISDLRLTNCVASAGIKLFFCSASNLSIEGDLHFVEAYKTSFYEVFNLKYRNLKLSNGNFQRWTFRDCQVNLLASNAVIQFWKFSGWDFNATISNTDLRDCSFESSPIQYPIGYGRAKTFHSHIKQLYSQIGRRKEASQHYYLQKTYERKSYLRIKANFQDVYYRNKSKSEKVKLYTIFFFKYCQSSFVNILWGYGERPARVFLISIATIFIFTFCYCFLPNASLDTKHQFSSALYFSMVTFSTLGYGDIHQTDAFLRLLSGIEAILGMSFWGILIAGFTSNAKDY